MHNRNGYIIAAILGGLIVLLIGLAGVGTWIVLGQLSTRQQLADIQATMAAQGIDLAPPDPTAVGQTPTVVPSSSPPAAPTKNATNDVPTPTAKAEQDATPTSAAATTTTPATEATTAATVDSMDGPLPDPMAAGEADWSLALAGVSRDKLAAHADAPVYRIGARFAPDANTITGVETILVTNAEDIPLDHLFLRLYPNALFYRDGGIQVSDVRVSGIAAQTTLEVDDTALRIVLPESLAPGQQTEIALQFVTTVPKIGAGYGIFGVANGVYSLYNWHPELAVYEDGDWLLNPVTEQGDPTNTDVANYQVVITTPQNVRVVTSGIEAEAQHRTRVQRGRA